MSIGNDPYGYDDEFRNSIATVDAAGKRLWVFAKKPAGYYHRLRIFVSMFLLGILFAGPFITIGGQPLLLLNFLERKFVLFGQAFWPQDFVVLAITLISFFVFIILFTVVFGRIWCGWMCPQTLFMEMVFRKIEYWLEGDANVQRKAARQPITSSLAARKVIKHLIFIVISSLIAHTVLAYIVGKDQVLSIMQHSPMDRLGGFVALTVFTGIFYSVFAFFREQACIAVCPYGRLQGVLLAKESIVVAYDWLRGEPRGKLKKSATEVKKGDCIDCKLCVHVCPTGIDIRNGTQLECVNCTACIDACDDVMIKIGKPKGLIRYASYNSILNGVQKLFSVRVLAYSIVLVALLSVLGFTLMTRTDVETTILKVSGTLYQHKGDSIITNLYNAQFVNKTFENLPVELRIESPAEAQLVMPDRKPVVVPAEGMLKTIYFIEIPVSSLKSAKTVVYVGVYEGGRLIETIKVKFIGPVGIKRSSQ